MSKDHIVKMNVIALLATSLLTVYGCGRLNSKPAESSASARIVSCPTTSTTAVSISNSQFQPASLAISVSDIVQWTNNDAIVHTVTSGAQGTPDDRFDSGNLSPGAKVCIQFMTAGFYQYFCRIHQFMAGTVVAQ
jgi:plastocyanin